MDEIIQHITALPGVETSEAMGATFFFYGQDRMFPFATIVTSDEHDQASDLTRPGVFRLNVGASKPTFQALFPDERAHDFTALDQIMPHPVYGKMYWVCVLNPVSTWERMKALIAEAYEKKRAG